MVKPRVEFCPTCRRMVVPNGRLGPRISYTITPLGKAVLAEMRALAGEQLLS
jgi:DNA-binding PadR family transcriptional regulator